MHKTRTKLPKRFQFTFTLVGLTILVIILSGLYLICISVWKLLWPIRKLISKIRNKSR
jgi:Co/Zn/Cd efflux system component